MGTQRSPSVRRSPTSCDGSGGIGAEKDPPFLRSARSDGADLAQASYRVLLSMVLALHLVPVQLFGDQVRAIDIFGATAWMLVLLAYTRPLPPERRLGALVGLVTIPIFSYLLAALLLYKEGLQTDVLLKTLRLVLILGPLALLLVIPLRTEQARKLVKLAAIVGGASVTISLAGYALGAEIFRAHQTLIASDGVRFNRLGGLVGETGAFGFYTLVVAGLIVIAWRASRAWVIANLVALTLVVAVGQATLARAPTAAGIVFVLASLWLMAAHHVRNGKHSMLVRAAASCIGFTITAILLIMMQRDMGTVDSVASRGFGSSGRFNNWKEVLGETLDHPLYGTGYRGSVPVYDVNTENLFVGALVDYGLVVGVLFLSCILMVARRIWAYASMKDEVYRSVLGVLAFCVLFQWQFNDVISYHQAFPLFIVALAPALAGSAERIRSGPRSIGPRSAAPAPGKGTE